MTVVEGTRPYPWPYDGALSPRRLAFVVAGAQVGWAERSRHADRAAAVIHATAAELRRAGALVVAIRHTATGRDRGRNGATPPRPPLPPRAGEGGWWLALHADPADVVVDAAGVDGFHGGPLDGVLRTRGIDTLVLGGFGHEAAVDSTLRSANDRGYECLVLEDAVAPFDDDLSAHALDSVTMSGGIFGAVGSSHNLVSAVRRRVPMEAVT